MEKIQKKVLDEIISRLVKEFAPDKIILFGSHAWGIPNRDSDIDLFVIVRRSDFTPIKRAKKAYQCLQGLRTPTEIIISTWDEANRYKSVHSSLTRKIFKQGKVIYG